MKIAMLVKNFVTTGGANRYAVELSRCLARKGHDVHVYAQSWDEALLRGLTLHRVRVIRRPRFLNSLVYALQVSRRTRRGSYDIVHSHQRTVHHHVLSMHHPCYQGGRLGIAPRHLAYRWLESRQFGCPAIRAVIAVSEQNKQDIVAHYPRVSPFIHVIYPGVDRIFLETTDGSEHRRAVRARHGIAEDDLALILVGSEFKRKGLRFLIDALALLRQHRALERIPHLLVLGGGDPAEFRELAGRHGLAGQIHFVGMTRTVERYYAAADLLVLPTLNEPFGMVVLEAMASGLPAVVSRIAGAAEVLRHGDNALLLDDPRDPKQIADAVVALSDPERRRAMGRRARDTARAFTWERMAEEIERLYQHAASNNQTGNECNRVGPSLFSDSPNSDR
ncbi:MAG: glycosyltransferase family 4 protein [Nitrospirota bacterium]